jgi:raffinose/stachyose/melibiose transport system substrate-binding protein
MMAKEEEEMAKATGTKNLVVLLVAVFFVAGAAAAFSATIPLTVLGWNTNYEDINKQIVADYKKINSNVELTFIEKDWSQYWTILPTMLQSGQAPNLFCTVGWSNSVFPNLVDQGLLVPFNGYFDSTQYPDWVLGWYSFKGKYYAIPGMSEDAYGVFYNKTLFSKYGLTAPKSQREMDNVLATLAKNGVTAISMPGKSAWDSFIAFGTIIHAYAADWDTNFPFKGSKFTSPAFINATKMFVSWIDKGYFGSQYKALDGNDAPMQVVQGQAAMYITGEYLTQTFKDSKDIGVFLLKRPDGKDAGVTSPRQDLAFSVYAKMPNRDAAIQFAKWYSGKDVQQVLENVGGGVPSGFEAAKGITTSDTLLQVFAQRNHTEMFWVDTAGLVQVPGQDIQGGMSALLARLLFKQITAEELAVAYDKFVDYTIANRQ